MRYIICILSIDRQEIILILYQEKSEHSDEVPMISIKNREVAKLFNRYFYSLWPPTKSEGGDKAVRSENKIILKKGNTVMDDEIKRIKEKLGILQ